MNAKDDTNKNNSHLLGRFKFPYVKEAVERELDGTATSADTMLILKEFELANFIRSSFIRSRKEYVPEIQRSLKLQLQERFNRK